MENTNITVYFRGINLIYADEDGTQTYYHFNAHGDVVVLTNESGEKEKTYSYTSFGIEYNPSTLDDNPFRYCGEYFDIESGNIYLRARYYNSDVGRFTQEDPIRDVRNWYSYCGNNPVNFVDPSGLLSKSFVYTCLYEGGSDQLIIEDHQKVEKDHEEEKKHGKSNVDIISNHPKDAPPDHPDFNPPKKGNKKVKNPNGKGNGWQANDGGVWVWTPGMHGGEGWTIQYPDGSHSHAYVGGGTRTHFEAQPSTFESGLKIFVGVVIVIVLLVDNATVVGVSDDGFIAVGGGIAMSGMDGFTNKNVCPECGGLEYGK